MLSFKNILRILVNTLIGVILIFVWLKLVNPIEILEALKKLEIGAILPFVFFFALSSFLRAFRLKLLLSQFKIPQLNMLSLTFVSQLLSFVIPLRIGELAKGVYLSHEYKIPLGRSIIWIFFDRFIDFWVVLVLALILLTVVPTNLPPNFKPLLIIIVILITIATILVVFLPKVSLSLVKIVRNIFIFDKLKKLFTQFSEFMIDGAGFLNKGVGGTVLILGVTIAALISEALGWMVLFKAIIDSQEANTASLWGRGVDFVSVLLGSLLSALTYLIPAAPGYVGSAEASSLAVFSFALGFDKTLTSIAGVLAHALTLICLLVFGLISLYFLKFNLDLVWSKLKR